MHVNIEWHVLCPQACGPIQVSVVCKSPGVQPWAPSSSVSGHSNVPVSHLSCKRTLGTDIVDFVIVMNCCAALAHVLYICWQEQWFLYRFILMHVAVVPQMVKPRFRSVSVGEQWLQQNRLQAVSASPSRTHCSFRSHFNGLLKAFVLWINISHCSFTTHSRNRKS